jgi:hypothetical protein
MNRRQISALVVALIGVALIIGSFMQKQRIREGKVKGSTEVVINLGDQGKPFIQARDTKADQMDTWMTVLLVAGVALVVVGVLTATIPTKKR